MSDARKPKTAPRVVHAAVEFVAAPAVPKRHRTRWILGDPDADAVEQEVEEHVRGRRGKDAKPTAERKAKDVERFELLAKATAKVPTVAPRKLYVDKRDGSIGEITTRDLGDKLLEREAIASEVADGVRPKAVLCEVCKCVVRVRRGNVPRTCARHARKKLCPRGCGKPVHIESQSCVSCKTPEEWSDITRAARAGRTTEQRIETLRKTNAKWTPEQRSEAARARMASKTPEERSVAARKSVAAQTPERRSEARRKGNAVRSPEERSDIARKGRASMTPEQRSEILRKMYAGMTHEQISDRQRKAWETRRAKKAAAEKAGEQ